MSKDGTNRADAACVQARSPARWARNSPPDAPPPAWKTRSTNPSTSQVMRLFAFWGVGVVLAWGRGLPDD